MAVPSSICCEQGFSGPRKGTLKLHQDRVRANFARCFAALAGPLAAQSGLVLHERGRRNRSRGELDRVRQGRRCPDHQGAELYDEGECQPGKHSGIIYHRHRNTLHTFSLPLRLRPLIGAEDGGAEPAYPCDEMIFRMVRSHGAVLDCRLQWLSRQHLGKWPSSALVRPPNIYSWKREWA
jgi:hypothetical protein